MSSKGAPYRCKEEGLIKISVQKDRIGKNTPKNDGSSGQRHVVESSVRHGILITPNSTTVDARELSERRDPEDARRQRQGTRLAAAESCGRKAARQQRRRQRKRFVLQRPSPAAFSDSETVSS